MREPLSASILKGDIPEAESILKRIPARRYREPRGCRAAEPVRGAADEFYPGASRPDDGGACLNCRLQISCLYSLERPANPQPLAYTVLQADSNSRIRNSFMSWVATLVTTYLLLTLMLSVALTWCINRLIVHPLRRIARS